MLKFFLITMCSLWLGGYAALAQYDSTYYESYADMLVGRFYFSQKYTALHILDDAAGFNLSYRPNTTVNMGIGATLGSATLNLAYGFDFLNPEDGKGQTKYLDLQAHLYGRKLIFDLFGQFYNGFYLNDKDLIDSEGNYYIRPDIDVQKVGISTQYMFNSKKFSYRAGFVQNEWQKKSAGTLLVGGQVVMGASSADSSFIPSSFAPVDEHTRRTLSFFEMGPSIGYAYTVVIKEHFFIMGSATVVTSIGYNELEIEEVESNFSFFPNLGLKAFMGYNKGRNAVSFTWTNDSTIQTLETNSSRFGLSTGNIRFNLIHRFDLHRETLFRPSRK